MKNSVLQLQEMTPEELGELIAGSVKSQLQDFTKNLNTQNANDDLLTREQACELLKIDPSTLWVWTKKGKVSAYGIANRRYYKRSELMDALILLKK